ncbi:hypothetical protein P154DRAFT_996 [Amniculicola lignicola CBS 123094]|uniref:F-box domain-containing protein n=1 Tax=Amniculicola lignicola CBS 123094 TaxID=1392246 RepID=A0A6A5X438_9PLEO|nr:hypothetical protein P154DRAFT_996 [Amniculicola lignicola CBS 123094]
MATPSKLKITCPHPPGPYNSPELGSTTPSTQYNQKTGRPIRKTAGHKKSLAGFVDSSVLEDDEPVDIPSEDDEGIQVKPRRVAKRKRSPSPPPPPLDPIIYNHSTDDDSDADTGRFHYTPSPQSPIVLQFNIPLGFHGPLTVKLDKSLLEKLYGMDEPTHDLQPLGQCISKRLKQSHSMAPEKRSEPDKIGFLDLPAELRNKVYRYCLVSNQPFHFDHPSNFCRSSALLRTCKVIHSEACSVLYGENKFVFDRNRSTRAPFWQHTPKEIGYQDVRTFLEMIGPENNQYLRDIRFIFEDANPGSTPYLRSVEDRRYINDGHLIHCLRILKDAKLRSLELKFKGRRALLRTDVKFLGYLEQLRADEVSTPDQPNYWNADKIHWELLSVLLGDMTRKKKLYMKEK